MRIEAGGLKFTADPALTRQLQRRAFDSCDANHDGVLSPEEFHKGVQV
nr:EF-hand domain-containing protein [Caulobacter sp. NIBR1757]